MILGGNRLLLVIAAAYNEHIDKHGEFSDDVRSSSRMPIVPSVVFRHPRS
jgi:hypothetical protein